MFRHTYKISILIVIILFAFYGCISPEVKEKNNPKSTSNSITHELDSKDNTPSTIELVIFGNHAKPPKIYLENGKPKGILVDIMHYIEKETKYTFDIKLYPWTRSYSMAEEGQGGIIGLSMTSERLNIFDFSEPMYFDDMVLVVTKGNEFSFSTINDLAGKRVGVNTGSSYGDEFEQGKVNIFKVDEDESATQRLNKLLAKRIDVALIGPGKEGVFAAIRNDPELFRRKDEFVILPTLFKRDPNYLGFAKSLNKKDVLSDINLVLKKGYQNGDIAAIIDGYTK